jgi:hypothetical protein
MKELSRRDALKLSAILGSAMLAPRMEKVEHTPQPLTDLPVLFTYNTPIKIDFPNSDVSEWATLSNVPVDILPPIYPIRCSSLNIEPYIDLQYAWVAKLPHITGSPAEVSAIVAWGDEAFYRHFNGSLRGKKGEYISTYAYTEKQYTYATKIWNDLTAYAAIAKWQKEHGPILPGETFSFLDMTNIRERLRKDYKMGLQFMGGGICATASTLSKSVVISSSRGYTEILKKHLHHPDLQYWVSPLDPGITKENSDATVYFETDPYLSYKDADFIFKVKEDSPSPIYLSFSASIHYDNNPMPRRDRYLGADARLTFSATVTTTPPAIDEESFLLDLRKEYADFHEFAY